MAEVKSTGTVTVSQSIARIQISVDAVLPQDDWLLEAHFEDAMHDAAGKAVSTKFGTRVVRRSWAQIKDDPEIVALQATIKNKIYQYRQEDIDYAENNPPAQGMVAE